MPTIEASKKDLLRLIGKKLDDKKLEEALRYAKSEIEGSGDEVKIEIADANRPDLLSIEGIARQCRLALGLKPIIYKAKKTNYKIISKSKVRPLIVAAVVKNLKFDDASIKQIIQLQEKLCEIFGRKRREAALGIYDFDKIKWPITYADYEPEKIKFIPLEMNREMTGKEILQKHPAGIAYKNLLENEKSYPLLRDSRNEVLSMPPIINSDYSGKITHETRNVFIEVTRYSYRFIMPVLNVVVSALVDRGGDLEEVKINNLITPNLKKEKFELVLEEVNSVLGLQLTSKLILGLLKKAGYDASGKEKIKLEIPFYRQDIIDSRDIIEDIAISYGYNKINPVKPAIISEGKENELIILARKISNLLIGLEFQEIATPTLTSKEILFQKMNKKAGKMIEIENPVSELYCLMRQELLSSALNFLEKNVTARFPQKIFETGIIIDENGNDKTHLVIASSHSQANFTELKQIFDYTARMLNINYKLEENEKEEFIIGRCAKIIIDKKEIGYLGEISPKILENFKLEFPVSVLEISLNEIFEIYNQL